MSDPIAVFVELAGATGQVTTYAAATSANYDPANPATQTVGAGTAVDVRVAPSKLFAEMLLRGMAAHFVARASDVPAGVVAGSSELTFRGIKYKIARMRRRYYLGVHNGWSFECTV